MPVETKTIQVSTQGFCDIIDITSKVEAAMAATGLSEGTITIFVPGSTAGLTTIEYESGCICDLKQAFERIAPMDAHYAHNARWGDGNGFAHVRAALLGASLHVPFSEKHLLTGTWQQIILVDFDNRLLRRALSTLVVGSLLVLGVGVLCGLVRGSERPAVTGADGLSALALAFRVMEAVGGGTPATLPGA